MLKSERMELRCSLEEKERWARAAGGSRLVSDWLRSLANASCKTEEPRSALAPFTAAVMQADVPSRVFESERPSAKRSSLCEHRRRVDEFCPRCD